jgi:hypothetical protein
MAMKYFQLKMKGARKIEDVESEVSETGAMILRVHVEHGQTLVYYGVPSGEGAPKGMKATRIKGAKEVSLKDVTKIG